MTYHSHRFITTARLALSASGLCLGLVLACGGTTESHSNDDSADDGPTTDGPTTDGGPSNGGPVTTGGAVTTGGPVTTSGPVTTGGPTTAGGNGGSGGGDNDCPSVEPAPGSGCSEPSQICSYPNCVAPDYRNGHDLECINGAWSVGSETVCDDVPLECPPNVYLGASCDVPEGTGPCTVYDACGTFRQVYCTAGYWQYGPVGEDAAPPPDGGGGAGNAGTGPSGTFTSGPIPAPTCPEFPPTPGQACCPADYPAYCDYTGAIDPGTTVGTQAATGGSFTVVSTGAGGTGSGALPNLTCAVCSPNLTWESSDACF